MQTRCQVSNLSFKQTDLPAQLLAVCSGNFMRLVDGERLLEHVEHKCVKITRSRSAATTIFTA